MRDRPSIPATRHSIDIIGEHVPAPTWEEVARETIMNLESHIADGERLLRRAKEQLEKRVFENE